MKPVYEVSQSQDVNTSRGVHNNLSTLLLESIEVQDDVSAGS